MKFVVAVHGTRGDVEPCVAVGLELMRRGQEVTLAVPPNLVEFAASAGVGGAVSYGVDSQQQLQAEVFRDWWELRNPITVLREVRDYVVEGWAGMSDTLTSISADADLILTGTTYQELAAVVAEAHHIPLGALHFFPVRPNTRVLPLPLPYAAAERVYALVEWAHWQVVRSAEAAQRRSLGLPPVRTRAVRRMLEAGAVEIQAYDEVFFPGLAEQWADVRPVVGALTLELDTEADDNVASWIAAGEPPIYFGFGSMPVEQPAEAMAKITGACADLGVRALICSGAWDIQLPEAGLLDPDRVKVVRSVNHAAVFPMCRAVVHHGGAGTTAAGVRAGVPSLVLWVGAEQPIWGAAVKKLGVGDYRRFSSTTREALRDALAAMLTPDYVARARETAARMTKPAESITAAADLLEAAAQRGRA
ncbi:glycosyltransferase [Mycolicibacterium sp. F2034L]|uniref:glycosyltransferase n=1 Tax=Mycolicibacterium sp. F2034L TaxID=2926422 RepID=UPI001FF24DA9|nr:glycosyltransferase [Mycolicibacterium sp. F2034L]MCK0175175.1 glycosyltransferase [Mycolicibacterium sp. F2034L]